LVIHVPWGKLTAAVSLLILLHRRIKRLFDFSK